MKIEVRRPYLFSQFELLQKEFVAFSHYHLTRFVGQLGFFFKPQSKYPGRGQKFKFRTAPYPSTSLALQKTSVWMWDWEKKNPKEED